MAYSDKIWDQIKKEWLAGQLSLSEISRNFGPTRQAILKRAKTDAWLSRGTLVEEIRREIDSALATGEDPGKVTAEVTPLEQEEIIAGATKRGLAVVRAHRVLLNRLFGQVKVTLSDLEEMERISLDLLKNHRLKYRSKMVTAIIKGRIDGADAISKILARAIPLERQAFSLDTEHSEIQSIKYVISEKIKKPKGSGLSEDDWVEEETE